MENNRRQSEGKEMHIAEKMRETEIEYNEDGSQRTKRQKRAAQLFSRFMKRRQSAKISKEIQGAQQSGQRTREQLVTASTDSGLMRKSSGSHRGSSSHLAGRLRLL